MADARTPMAWQHRDMMGNGGGGGGHHPNNQRNDSSPSRRYTPTPNSQRYGGPPTPNSAHSRHSSRTPDHRRDARGSSSERYSLLPGQSKEIKTWDNRDYDISWCF